jgi:hypothetical protein
MAPPPTRGSTNLIPSRARLKGQLKVASPLRCGELVPFVRAVIAIIIQPDLDKVFAVLSHNGLVERLLSWLGLNRRLAKDRERLAGAMSQALLRGLFALEARQPATRRVQIESKRSRDASAQPARGYRRRRPRAAGERLPSRAARHTQRRRRSPPPQRCRRT